MRITVRDTDKTIVYAISISGILFLAGIFVGFFSFNLSVDSLSEIFLVSGSRPQEGFWNLAGKILLQNSGACLLMFSGIVTFGFSSVMSIFLVGVFVGATAHIGVQTIGAFNLITDVLMYVFFEFFGIVVAAAAGMLPVTGKIRQHLIKTESGFYVESIAVSLKLLAAAVVSVIIGAVIEAFVIVSKQ